MINIRDVLIRGKDIFLADNHRVNSFLTVCVKQYEAIGYLVDGRV